MKKIIILVSLFFISLFNLNIFANDNKVVDETGSLSGEEIEELNSEIKTLIDEVNFDVVVYFTNKEGNVTDLADDYFDYNGYGLNKDLDGIILCVNYYDHECAISTSGANIINLFDDDALNYVFDNVTYYLSIDDKIGAINEFIESVRNVYSDNSTYNKLNSEDNIKTSLIIGAFGGMIISLVIFLVLKGQLKSQGIKNEAYDYMKKSSINIFRSGEIFLYKNVTTRRIERPKNNGGPSIHISSSGRSHGGGSRGF